MKRLKFGTKDLNIKSDLLARIVTAAVGSPEMTREAISRSASVSLSSAGKLLSALDECSFTEVKYSRSLTVGSPSKRHVFRGGIWLLVLDLSSSVYAAHIVSCGEHTVITERHAYDPTLSFEGNLIALLSRIGLKISALPYSVSAICTVTADGCENHAAGLRGGVKYLPSQSDIDTVNAYCARFFGVMPSFSLTYSQALSCAEKYNLLCAHNSQGTAYIGLCESARAIYLRKGDSAIPLRVGELMIDGATLLRDVDISAIDSAKAAELIARLINHVSCAYPADGFVVEVELNRFPDISREVELILMSLELAVPQILYFDTKSPTAVLGASHELLTHLICSHLHGT